MTIKRCIRFAAPLGLAAVVAGAVSTHAAKPAPTQTQSQSQAVIARLVPYVGLPGVTTSVGLVTSQVANGTAQASAAAADFGLVGTLAGGAAPTGDVPGAPALELPSPISADSEGTTAVERDPFAAATGQAQPAPGSASVGSAAHESATAARNPLGATGTVVGPALNLPGVFEISAGRSSAASTAKGALSEVTLDSINLGGGQVVLSGLRWAANQSTSAAATSGFSLRGITLAGQALPVDTPAEFAASIAQANTALAPLGLNLDAPTNVADAGGGTVAPLVLQFRNPEALVEPSRQVSSALSPVVTELVNAAIAANPDAAAAQIVANAVVGATGGRSGARIELGGASARSSLVALDDLLNTVGDLIDTNPAPTGAGGGGADTPIDNVAAPAPAAVGDLPAVDFAPADPATGEVTPATQNTVALGAASKDGSGLAIAALAIGLLATLILAVGDRLRMAATK